MKHKDNGTRQPGQFTEPAEKGIDEGAIQQLSLLDPDEDAPSGDSEESHDASPDGSSTEAKANAPDVPSTSVTEVNDDDENEDDQVPLNEGAPPLDGNPEGDAPDVTAPSAEIGQEVDEGEPQAPTTEGPVRAQEVAGLPHAANPPADVASSTGPLITLAEPPKARNRSPLASVDPRHPTRGVLRFVRGQLPSERDAELCEEEHWSKLPLHVLQFVARRAVIWLFSQSPRWRGVTPLPTNRRAAFVFSLGLSGESVRDFNVQLKAVRQPSYTYFPAGPRHQEDDSLAALVRFLDGHPPIMYLIPTREWTTLESYPLLTRRSFAAELNKPDKLGINLAANLDMLERFRLERTVERLAHDPELGRPSEVGRGVRIPQKTKSGTRKPARSSLRMRVVKRPLPK